MSKLIRAVQQAIDYTQFMQMLDSDDMLEEVARAIQLEDADCFPTLGLKKKDYVNRLAIAVIAAIKRKMENS